MKRSEREVTSTAELLRVAIVDDEPWIVKGIARSCDWARHGAEVTIQCADPEEAIRRILAEKPDIVLTDVNMGPVSGLDLMARVRAAGVDCAFVVISGYDDFAYAQQAMELGASHYLLKPLKREELDSVMTRLSVRLAGERSGSAGGDDVAEWLSLHGINTHRMLFAHFHVPCGMDGWQAAVADGEGVPAYLGRLREAGIPFVSLGIGLKRQVLYFNADTESTDPSAPCADRVTSPSWMPVPGKENLTIGFGVFHAVDCHPATSWQEADLALDGRFVDPAKSVYRLMRQPEKMRGVLERFLQAFDHPSSILPFLEGFGAYARENGYGIGDVLWVYNLFCVTWNHAGPGEGTERFSVASVQELTSLFRNVDEMGAYLREATVGLLREKLPVTPPAGARFEELLRHIEAHYAEPLYLCDLASLFHYNATYVSDLFRKHLGRGFTEHLTILRMNRAKNLLLGTDLPVTEVAARCGYPDACHFTRQFRKATGLAPRAFRNAELAGRTRREGADT